MQGWTTAGGGSAPSPADAVAERQGLVITPNLTIERDARKNGARPSLWYRGQIFC